MIIHIDGGNKLSKGQTITFTSTTSHTQNVDIKNKIMAGSSKKTHLNPYLHLFIQFMSGSIM